MCRPLALPPLPSSARHPSRRRPPRPRPLRHGQAGRSSSDDARRENSADEGEIEATRKRKRVAGSRTIKTDGTQLSDDERARLKAEWPDNFSQSNALVWEMLRYLDRPECKGRVRGTADDFQSVRSFQASRGRAKANMAKASAEAKRPCKRAAAAAN